MTGSQYLYREAVTAPKWLAFLIFGGIGFVGFMIGIVTARGALDGGERVLFYVAMVVALVIQTFVAFNFLTLTVGVTSDAVEFAYGIFRRRFKWSQITSFDVQRYDWKRYGGWGLRYGLGGRRAWSMPGVPEGVTFKVAEDSIRREYFVSSRDPQALARSVSQASGSAPG